MSGYDGPPRERRGFRGTSENAKTVLCTRITSPEGCRFGDRCNFAHTEIELKPRRNRFGGGGGQVCARLSELSQCSTWWSSVSTAVWWREPSRRVCNAHWDGHRRRKPEH